MVERHCATLTSFLIVITAAFVTFTGIDLRQYLVTKSVEVIVSESWEAQIKLPKENWRFKRFAVGVNGNVDLIIKGSHLIKSIDQSANTSRDEAINHDVIDSTRDLQQSFTYHHHKGAGGERFMTSKDEFDKVLTSAKALEDIEYFIGGNAALMAEKFASLIEDKGRVLLGVPVGPVLQPLLHPRLKVAEGLSGEDDEYHIIMEYGKGESWGGKTSPIASRFIFSHDVRNSKMAALENFIFALKDFAPDLLILSGFHLLESQDRSFWLPRITEISTLLKQIPAHLPIHVELASMANKVCMGELVKKIFPLVDSIGLNEQELWMVCQIGGGPHCATTSPPGPPGIPTSADIVEWTIKSLLHSRLSRVHFHTLPYHLVVTSEASRWRNQDSSVAAGTRVASTQACDDVIIDPEKVELRVAGEISLSSIAHDAGDSRVRAFDPANPVTSWARSGFKFNLSPVLVCRNPVKTVGLGDAISAAGLVYSGFVR